MRLIDLEPRWVGAGGDGISDKDGNPVSERHGIGVSFKCPCGQHDEWDRVFVAFSNPVDGGPPHDPRLNQQWQRTGDSFETLTLAPSIQRHKIGEHGCEWHGFVTNGEIKNA